MAEGSKFDTVAASYAAGRPDYPAELYETLESVAGRPLAAMATVDLGAGTGIAARQLAQRGAIVTAVELSGPMIALLAASSPGVHAVRGSATALPLRDGCADLITSAQAWHWMDPTRAVPELRRVLRPGGVFAAWWNYTRRDSEWEREQEERIEAAAGPHWRAVSSPFARRGGEMGPDFDLPVSAHEFAWHRTITIERHLNNLRSKSYVAALPHRDGFLAAEHAILSERFPDGSVTERFGTHMVTAVMPARCDEHGVTSRAASRTSRAADTPRFDVRSCA